MQSIGSKVETSIKPKQKNKLVTGRSKYNMQFFFMVLPGIIWFLIFSYLPMFGIIIAFKDLRISGDGFLKSLKISPWVGFENFKFLFQTSDAFLITRNTILYNLVFIFLGLVLSVTFAILISQLSCKKFAKFCQSAMFLPYFLSWVVASYFVFIFLSMERGMLNQIISSFGGTPVEWYANPKPWPVILILSNIWKGTGYGTVVYLAAIVGIDQSYYEAAMIDGATKWQQIKDITLPMIKPVIVMLTLLSVGRMFYADFGLFYQVPKDSGPLYPVTDVIDTYVYRALNSMHDFGMSSAAGLYQSTVGFILILLSNYIVRKVDNENALF